ncbi:MAG: alpha/beta fold hydrolase [Oligoflexia bacterium]|nr:alpha/beta fold hydrolase [Oligoflexia bacterium]
MSSSIHSPDQDFAPALVPVLIPSHGSKMLGRILTAEGPGPHPVAIFLHGLPGNENNFDMAHAVRRAGWNALHFHYRGSWGSEGAFSIGNVVEDAKAAIDFVKSPAVAPYRCDPSRIAVIGHSTGGFAALIAGSRDPSLLGVASIAGFNFGAIGALMLKDNALRTAWLNAFRGAIAPLKGLTADDLIAEITGNAPNWRLESFAPALEKMKTLIVWCSRDIVSIPEIHHHPLIKAFEKTNRAFPLEVSCFETDHYVSGPRVELATELIRWLRTLE